MKNVIPLALLRKRARERKDKERKQSEPQQFIDPTVRHDAERKQSRYDTYEK